MNRILDRGKRLVLSKKHKYLDKFVFIHINKTGGSSVEKALGIRFEHKTALEKIEEIGRKNWDKKLSFSVVRNPWDRVVSHYHYRVKTNQTGLGDSPIEFAQWVKFAYADRDSRYYDKPKMFMPQTKWITDNNGNILVDEVIHFENLEFEFNKVQEKLGTNVYLPHLKQTNRGSYRSYYDGETIELVKVQFEQDIERFGYQY